MNETIQVLHNHRSDRSYLNTPVADEILDQIIQAAYLAPTSINSQQVSVIITRDAGKRQKIADISGGQPWIAQAPVFITLVLDLHKTELGIKLAGQEQIAHQTIEGLLSGCTDVGIALGSMIAAAHALGLGIVPIGAVRSDPQAMIELLNLPEHTFPVVGLVLGYVDKATLQKPRLPYSTFRHNERYDDQQLIESICRYEPILMAHWQRLQRSDGFPWQLNTAKYYHYNYFPKVLPALLQQGFKFEQ